MRSWSLRPRAERPVHERRRTTLSIVHSAEIHRQADRARTVYASFLIGDEEFALDVHCVQEVVNLPAKIAPMPLSPDFVAGVFNLRGVIIPMLSMARLL